MNEFVSNFHFIRPWWLLALTALPLVLYTMWHASRDSHAWRVVVDAHLLPHVLTSNTGSAQTWPKILTTVSWLVVCLALAGPAWERAPQALYSNHAARVLLLELAPSMLASDLKPTRLERARYKISDALKRNSDGQSALIAYAGDAFVVAPLTDDANTVSNLLDALDPSVMPIAGNDTARAIDQGVKLIQQAGMRKGEVVLFADSASSNAVAAARRAMASGVRISVMAIGTAQGAPVTLPQGGFLQDANGNIVMPRLALNDLQDVATAGGGRFAVLGADNHDLDTLFDATTVSGITQASSSQAHQTLFRDRGPWLLLVLLPLVALGFRRGWLLLLVCAITPLHPAHAFDWQDLWQRRDQQAMEKLNAGDAKTAQQLAESPALRGTAAYRAGDYAEAADAFSVLSNADAHYNHANALAKQQNYSEALAEYEQALKLSPDMADALANKQAIEDWLKQQKSDEDNKRKNNQDKNTENQKSNQSTQKPNEQQSPADQQQDQAKDSTDSPSNQQADADPSHNSNDKSSHNTAQQSQPDATHNPENSSASDVTNKQAEHQFQQSMDQALQDPNSKPKEPLTTKPVGVARDAPPTEQQQALEQWLQRVPDDPGGLLRRKFQLEYQRRQGRAGE